MAPQLHGFFSISPASINCYLHRLDEAIIFMRSVLTRFRKELMKGAQPNLATKNRSRFKKFTNGAISLQ
jgi:hypothetical protein